MCAVSAARFNPILRRFMSSDYPTAHNSEKALLSCVMRGGSTVRKRAIQKVRPDMFDEYQDMARVVLNIATDGRPDAETVKAKAGLNGRVDEVAETRVAPTNIDEFIADVGRTYLERQGLDRLFDAANRIGDDDILQILDDVMSDVIKLTTEAGDSEATHVSDLAQPFLQKIEDEQGTLVTGIRSGFRGLDRITKGWDDGELIIPFASTSMGKTAFSLACAENAAANGHHVLISSLEMAARAIFGRLASRRAKVDITQRTIPEEQMGRLTRAVSELHEMPIWIDDTAPLDVLSHRAQCRRYKHQHGLDMAIVDYLQELSPPESKDRKHDEVHAAAGGLKTTAKRLEIPVICPSQTTRKPDSKQGHKRPSLSDLREAGEEPADIAIGLYRPDYYGITKWDDGTDTKGQGEASVAKNRNGQTGSVRLAFVEKCAAWEPLGDEPPTPADDSPYAEEPAF